MAQIRSTTTSDLSSLGAIERSAAQAFLRADGLEWVASASICSDARHLAFIKAGTHWVTLDEEGRPAGFLFGERQSDAFHIWELSVDLAHQRKGMARALVEYALGFATSAGLGHVTLTTFRDVPWNAPFYRSFGFEIVDETRLSEALASVVEHERLIGRDFERRCAMRVMIV